MYQSPKINKNKAFKPSYPERIMNKKRAIGIAIVLYLTTFIIGIVLTIITRTVLESPQNIPTTYWIITIIVTVFLTSLASLWYFNKEHIARNIKEGLKLGVIFIISGFILDILFFIPTFFTEAGAQILIEYYTTSSFYMTLFLVIATTIFIGSRGEKSQKEIAEKKPTKKIKK